jgi:hypothetical protein
MQQKIDRLELAAVYHQQQAQATLLKPTKPSEFHGEQKNNVNLWIAELTRYFAATNNNGNERTVYAIALLKAHALEWVTHEPQLSPLNAPNVTFDHFTALILARFSPIENSKQARYDGCTEIHCHRCV